MTWKTPVMTRLNRRRAARDGGRRRVALCRRGTYSLQPNRPTGKEEEEEGTGAREAARGGDRGGDTGRLFVLLSPDSAACKSVCVWNNKLCVFVAWWRSFAWPAGAMRSM